MNAKDRYKSAVKNLEEMLAVSKPIDGMPTPEQMLEDIHRYAGELRRKVAALEMQKEQDQRQIANSKQVLERLQNLPEKVEALERAKTVLEKARNSLSATNDNLQRRIAELEVVATAEGRFTDVEDHTQIKVKCMDCSLHFTLFTWSPETHSCKTLHCPECGQHHARFLVWKQKGRGFIFQNVPGNAQFVDFGSDKSQTPPASVAVNVFDIIRNSTDN